MAKYLNFGSSYSGLNFALDRTILILVKIARRPTKFRLRQCETTPVKIFPSNFTIERILEIANGVWRIIRIQDPSINPTLFIKILLRVWALILGKGTICYTYVPLVNIFPRTLNLNEISNLKLSTQFRF